MRPIYGIMNALKSFESPDYAPGYFSRNLYWIFVPIDTVTLVDQDHIG